MGQLKKLIPRSKRPAVTEAIKAQLPEGPIRNHAADAVTVTGLGLIAAGAKLDGRFGMFLRMMGKFGDDLDGDLARMLGTQSRFGALLDAIVDKAGVAIEVPVLLRHAALREGPTKAAHRVMIGTIAAKHTTNAALNAVAMARGRETNSSKMGKVNAYVDGMTAGFMGISDVAKSPAVRTGAEVTSYAFFAAGLVTGALTAKGYYDDAFGPVINMDGGIEVHATEVTATELDAPTDPWIEHVFSKRPWLDGGPEE